mmetsp:Transcript_15904/g.27410  ORF Transcript_15904/g.27410 Transcript_15904/m.27410 type:complete len:343 (+) Transcript_15904:180-1208(+)
MGAADDSGEPRPEKKTIKLITAKTRRGRRILEKRAPKLVEDAKKVLILYGSKTSQVIKDVLVDLHKLKKMEAVKFTRKNEDCRPLEVGGEQHLEFYARKADCGLFAMGSHSKKRPHNLVMGRFFDDHFYDAIEFGIDGYQSINAFGSAAAGSGLGGKPCILFVGEKFESVPALKVARSTLLDMFRGEQVESVNLAGVDRVMTVSAISDTQILLRQYVIKLKRSGTRVPRVELQEMGPRLDMTVRRHRPPPVETEKEALKQPLLGKKKEKNVSSDMMDGKVGRIYMPKQKVDTIALSRPKGTKREGRDKAADRKSKRQKADGAGVGQAADTGNAPDGGSSKDL